MKTYKELTENISKEVEEETQIDESGFTADWRDQKHFGKGVATNRPMTDKEKAEHEKSRKLQQDLNDMHKAAFRKEEAELDEVNKGPQPGWMLKQDSMLNQKIKDTKKAYKKLRNPSSVKEEVEELDELSKSTLGSYIKKASTDKAAKALDNAKNINQSAEKLLKRHIGINKAVDKLTKEEVEELDELSKKTLGSYVNKASAQQYTTGINRGAYHQDSKTKNFADAAADQASKRQKGIAKAVSKLTKEEVEELDELSKSTLGSYVNKAKDSRDYYNDTVKTTRFDSKLVKDAAAKSASRQKGINAATSKLNKEEVELDEANSLHHARQLARDVLRKVTKKKINEWTSSSRVGGFGSSYSRSEKEAEISHDHGSERSSQAPSAHSVHINGKKWKTFGTKSHAINVARKIKGATVVKEEVELDEDRGAYELHDPKHPDFVKNHTKWKKQNPNGKLGDFIAHMKTKKFNVKEEVEELDELSKQTLGSYVKKASEDAAGSAAYAMQTKGQGHGKPLEKAFKRLKGVAKATDKLTKEEVEELDELSKQTLGSYVKKASYNAADSAYNAGSDKQPMDQRGKSFNKSLKRIDGIAKATNKLTKEEIKSEHTYKDLLSWLKEAKCKMKECDMKSKVKVHKGEEDGKALSEEEQED